MEKKSTRQAYGEALVKLGKENKDVVVLEADLSKSTMTAYFQKEFPCSNRTFQTLPEPLYPCAHRL